MSLKSWRKTEVKRTKWKTQSLVWNGFWWMLSKAEKLGTNVSLLWLSMLTKLYDYLNCWHSPSTVGLEKLWSSMLNYIWTDGQLKNEEHTIVIVRWFIHIKLWFRVLNNTVFDHIKIIFQNFSINVWSQNLTLKDKTCWLSSWYPVAPRRTLYFQEPVK